MFVPHTVNSLVVCMVFGGDEMKPIVLAGVLRAYDEWRVCVCVCIIPGIFFTILMTMG